MPDQPAMTTAPEAASVRETPPWSPGAPETSAAPVPAPAPAGDRPRPRRNRAPTAPAVPARPPSGGPGDGSPRLSRKDRKSLGKLRARKVRRVVRHIDPWSLLKVSLIFYLCMYVTLLVAGVVLWNLASGAGTIDDIEGFVREMGAYETWEFRGGLIFEVSAIGGLVLVVAGTGFNVLVAVLFNLISDLVGGVRFTVLEEDAPRRRGTGDAPAR